MSEVVIKENERIDTLKVSGYKIIQDPKRFCFGIDAFLLANYAKARRNSKVVDLCSGTAIIPFIMAHNTCTSHFDAVEVQSECADMAKRSVILNDLQDKISVIEENLQNYKKVFSHGYADVVTCNPPYMINEHGIKNPFDSKAIARHEILCNLDDICKAASYILKGHGSFYMIHRPFRLAEIFSSLMKYGLEPKSMRLVHPHRDEEPNMVLIQAVKDGSSRITIEKPLVVYESDGTYTQEVIEIYNK